MYEKPMTENQKKYGNMLYKFMKNNGCVTKTQMLAALGWDNSKDRQLRDLISQIAKKVPVVSTSDSRGYYIPKDEKDIELVKHQKNELVSRINELQQRVTPLNKFIEEIDNKNQLKIYK